MNFAGFQKIIASTAAHIDRAVAVSMDFYLFSYKLILLSDRYYTQDKVSEVTGPKALSEYDIGDQV